MLNLASPLLQWISQDEANKVSLLEFEAELVRGLKSCISSNTYSRKKHDNSAIPQPQLHYCNHMLISSSELKKQWNTFLATSVSAPPCAQLQQNVMQFLGDTLLQQSFPLSSTFQCIDASGVDELSIDEEQGLKYACGFIMKKVREDIEKNQHSSKDEMLTTISDLTALDPEVHCSYSVEWMHTIDRGSLT